MVGKGMIANGQYRVSRVGKVESEMTNGPNPRDSLKIR